MATLGITKCQSSSRAEGIQALAQRAMALDGAGFPKYLEPERDTFFDACDNPCERVVDC
ncbi:MAG: hypothetical protein AMXMBFR36_04160 [Acidobacteriota bacterium]